MAMCVTAVVGAAPCQCFSPGGIQTTSPGRISSMGPPQRCVRPQPNVTMRVWPRGCVCQAVRAPGSNVTLAPATRAGSGAANNGSMRTVPVNPSAGPLPEGCEPLFLMSICFLIEKSLCFPSGAPPADGAAYRSLPSSMSDVQKPAGLPVLLVVLTITTGLIDAISVLGLGRVFTANMTGNIVFLGFALAGVPGFSPSRSLIGLAAFLAAAGPAGRARGPPHASPQRPRLIVRLPGSRLLLAAAV